MFALPSVFQIDQPQTVQFVVTVLYIMGPIYNVVGYIETFNRVKVATNRLREFDQYLTTNQSGDNTASVLFSNGTSFSSINLNNIRYEYAGQNGEENFILGPLDLTIAQGETMFITGGNGSGKSTFLNVLTTLYPHHQGSITIDNKIIDESGRSEYRRLFSVVLNSPHLFKNNYRGLNLSEENPELQSYLRLFEMDKKIKFNNQVLESEGFSLGQKKRIALIMALLENRPILVLDEWAAEQDPKFRALFYTKILPILKERGKTIIAITHDERYFSLADRVIKLDYGKIVDQNVEA